MFFLDKIWKNVFPHADILSWCLMPNHFHLMISVKQVEIDIEERALAKNSEGFTLSEDANDCNTLRDDTILKMSVGRLPMTGNSLASQSTMTSFENTPRASELYNIAYTFADQFIGSYPPVIIIDCDDTNSDTHGAQQLSLFSNYYGEYCYMPLHIYEGLSGKLITTILKPGRRSKR